MTVTTPPTSDFPPGTPAAQGYRLPAEWEPHAGTWLSWPHNRSTWPHQLEVVEEAFAAMVRALAPHEAVHVNVLDEAQAARVRRRCDAAGVTGSVHLHVLPTDDAWIRDYGALVVVRDRAGRRERAATTWTFNSWGEKYPPWEHDDAAAGHMAALLGLPVFEGGLVLEGGAIDVDGAGLLLTTRSCLLPPRRNPGWNEQAVTGRLRAFFGAERVLWLDGRLAGDDTDGHVDTMARFVAAGRVLAVASDRADDPDRDVTQANLETLRAARTPRGERLEVLRLPAPAPVYDAGARLPASYANFYVANGVVLVPTYRDAADEEAVGVIGRCFPERRVVAIDCRDVVWGLGALHCLTQQIPAGDLAAGAGPVTEA